MFFYSSCLILAILLLLQVDTVQTFFARKVVELVSEKSGHVISIEKVEVSWLDHASLRNVLIEDLHGDTLIYARQLEVDYRVWNLIRGDFFDLQEVLASDIYLNLIKYDVDSKLNLTEFINSLKGEQSAEKVGKAIRLEQIDIGNFNFKLDDKSKEPKSDRVDFSHMDFQIPAIGVNQLTLELDTISGNITQLIGKEQRSGFDVRHLATSFRLTGQSLSLDDLDFKTPSSTISDSLEFFFNGLDDLAYFVDSVSFVMHLDNSRISNADIQLITGLNQLKSDLLIDGVFWGTVGDFNIEDARIGLGENTFFEGGVSCFGLPDVKQAFILADITKSQLLPADLEPYIGAVSENLKRMGKIRFNGSFAGFLKDFVARGDFYTDQGSIHTDINLKIPADPSNMSYIGNLELREVNIGSFLKNNIVQKINLKSTIKGKGIKRENADFDMNASMYNSVLNGYSYDSVKVNGHFSNNFFEGTLAVVDENCQVTGKGQIDLRSSIEKIDLDLYVQKLYADRLNLSESELFASGHINLQLADLDLNSFQSSLAIDSGLLMLGEKELVFDSVRFSAALEDNIRVFDYQMPGLKFDVRGAFNVSDVIKDIPKMISNYSNRLNFSEDTVLYIGSEANYNLILKAKIDNVSSYLDSLNLPVTFFGNTFIEASFRQSKNANLSFFASTDSIKIGRGSIANPTVEINGAIDESSTSTLTNFIFTSSKQQVLGMPYTQDLLVEGVWLDNEIEFSSTLEQPATESNLRLESVVHLYQDSITLRMDPSDIEILDDTWKFNPSNQIVFKADQTSITNLEIYDSSESIRVNGIYARTIPTEISLIVEDLNMNKANLFTNSRIGGFLNGSFKLFRESESEPFKYEGGFLLKNLMYDEVLLGDVTGTSNWNPTRQAIDTDVKVQRENFRSIQAKGTYYPSRETEQLDFNVDFDQADLELVKPFIEKNFSNVGGTANGSLKITGETKAPVIVGNCSISDGSVTIDYLNTSYTFDGRVNFNPSTISFTDFNFTDRKGSTANLSGIVRHKGFSNFLTDVRIRSNNFEFLNTTSLENNLYYGSAYGTGTVDITGPLTDLKIKADIRTEADTRFFVPISESTNIIQEDYIEFVDLRDTTVQIVDEKKGIRGLTLDFDIEVTPEAYCELIFDIKTGDIIRGRGRGNIKLSLNSDGEFNMFGPLEITEGAYNFTIPNLINKEFQVVPGSRITWYGSPYNATLDIEATYLQRASLEELKNPENQIEANLSDKIPFLVVLILDGGMFAPEITFDIRFQNPSDGTAENEAELELITGNASNNTNNEELRRQVISLLFLKRFSPRESFSLGGGSGTIGSSVSEFLSSQVSYLVSQIDENLEVEVNLAELNQEAFNTFQLRFAYTFLDGRLKVTRGGSFGNQQDQNGNVLNDIVGDWSVEYSLTKDGRLRAKVFRNSNQRLITVNGQQSQETGVSLRFVQSFNDLTDLLTFQRQEAIRRKEEEGTTSNLN